MVQKIPEQYTGKVQKTAMLVAAHKLRFEKCVTGGKVHYIQQGK
jgi:hypothetical protein